MPVCAFSALDIVTTQQHNISEDQGLLRCLQPLVLRRDHPSSSFSCCSRFLYAARLASRAPSANKAGHELGCSGACLRNGHIF